MIFKTIHVKASRVSTGKASSSLKSHFKYLQYRGRDEQQEARQDRHLFGKEYDHVDRKEAHTAIMAERAGDIYYHRMVLSPSDQEPVTGWHQWTRDVMRDLERHLGTDLYWYATVHRNTDNPHVHVVLRGTGGNRETGQLESVELTPKEFKLMRESGREHSDYEHYRQLEDVLRELEQQDLAERTQESEHARELEREQEFSR